MTHESGGTVDEGEQAPLEFLVAVMRNKALDLPMRIDAAKAAAPYLHPRLNMIDARFRSDQPSTVALSASEMLALAATFDEAAIDGEAVEVSAERGER